MEKSVASSMFMLIVLKHVTEFLAAETPMNLELKFVLQKLKTRVVKKNLNPEWNDILTLCVSDPNLPVKLVSTPRNSSLAHLISLELSQRASWVQLCPLLTLELLM